MLRPKQKGSLTQSSHTDGQLHVTAPKLLLVSLKKLKVTGLQGSLDRENHSFLRFHSLCFPTVSVFLQRACVTSTTRKNTVLKGLT